MTWRNREVRFSPDLWRRWLEKHNRPEDARLATGIQSFRKLLERYEHVLHDGVHPFGKTEAWERDPRE